jgi:hypothetical protein
VVLAAVPDLPGEFELALGIWLVAGLFKRLAWFAALLCFSLFCCVTLYKALTGAASCGCFGTAHVNPWVTLFAIDLPAVALLLFLQSQGVFASLGCSCNLTLRVVRLSWRSARRAIRRSHSHAGAIFSKALTDTISARGLVASGAVAVVLGVTTPILTLNQPPRATVKYEVLEPETWLGKELPILEYIDISSRLRTGTWIVLFYHWACPDCQKVISQYQTMAREMARNEASFRIAFVEVPPYGPVSPRVDAAYTLARLADVREWFVTTPATALLTQGEVKTVWEISAPDFDAIITKITLSKQRTGESQDSSMHSVQATRSAERRWCPL